MRIDSNILVSFIRHNNSTTSADISVILPHFNAVETIGRSIRSVVSQTLSAKELIIIDDFSNGFENLVAIVEEFKNKLSIKLIRLDVNSGASEARNQGVRIATGKYLAFLDSDDVWHPEKINIQYSLMLEHDMTLSGHSYVQNLNHAPMVVVDPIRIKKISPNNFIFRNPFFTPTIMVLKSSFIEFDKRYRRVDDYKCWLMNAMTSDVFLISAPMAGGFKTAIGSSGLTSSMATMHQSYITVLNDMYRERLIGFWFFVAARFIEVVKYPLRFVKYNFLKCLLKYKMN